MEELDKIKKCKSLSEAVREVFGYTYYNGRVKNELVRYCYEKYGINIEQTISDNKDKRLYCLQCGKKLIGGQKKFCSSSCSAKYNNTGRKLSETTKIKISNSLLNKNPNRCDNDSIERYSNGRVKPKKVKRYCIVCGHEFETRHKKSKHCSQKCVMADNTIKQAIKEKIKERILNGTFKGWNKRNITSYPEKFWEVVLKNNHIEYEREVHVGKYFLDFVIKNGSVLIDLEIDGKQHEYDDRKLSDEKRDIFLKNEGYYVYRVKWNCINNKDGQKLMKKKIDDFLSFYLEIK